MSATIMLAHLLPAAVLLSLRHGSTCHGSSCHSYHSAYIMTITSTYYSADSRTEPSSKKSTIHGRTASRCSA